MNEKIVCIDTNIAIYMMKNDDRFAHILQDKSICTSLITEIELLGYQGLSYEEKQTIVHFLRHVSILAITDEVKLHTINLRSRYTIKLPDAIILATALAYDYPLLTADKHLEKIYIAAK